MVEKFDDRRDEFVRLLCECERRLFSYILALVWNMQDAEDLYQATAMTMWQKFDEFQPGSDFSRWAFTTARLLAANFQRTKQRRHEFLSADLATQLAEKHVQLANNDFDMLTEALLDCMKTLSDADRHLLTLCYNEEQSIKDVAAQLGRPVQSTYNSLFRIRRSLFECIQRAIAREGGQ